MLLNKGKKIPNLPHQSDSRNPILLPINSPNVLSTPARLLPIIPPSMDAHHKGQKVQAPKLHTPKGTHPLLWCLALVCSVLAVAVIIAGIVVFVGYLVYHPRIPIISVVGAHLNLFQYDLAGVLVTQVNIVVRTENDNTRAHASLSDMKLTLIFDGIEIAKLMAEAYEVRKNSSVDFNFLATSAPIPLNPQQMKDVDVFLNEDEVRFDLKGNVRARWRVGLLGSIKFQCHLNCQLSFHRSSGDYIPVRCTSKAK
ncbi:hypothetical protein P3X46_013580 [Hevea brasiliensis]|uniref:Late embryogenesis abundant protein LEA-2 subgroup domain-containing protein n=1 Tax=Hevea brasiliensis TaxID=3981 RepID=A0ABQ9M540_HEVBR|nr:NDR1/HIN1-like protein 13 [Hevea brasiliensis]KAJ9174993.1 hypothetical protein P3X46_013580 [Hevea brasiliensis]